MSNPPRPEDIAALPYRHNVGIMLVNGDNLVFVGQRSDRPANEPIAWQMPQGGIDDGETPRDAAFRELEEETGVRADLVTLEQEAPGWISYDLPLELVPRIWGGRYRGQKQKWFLMRFHGWDSQIRIDADDHQEFLQWRWAPPETLVSSIVPFKRAVYRQVLDTFGPKLRG